MKQGLSTAFGLIFEGWFAMFIAHNKVVWTQVPFVLATGGDEQAKRFSIDDRRIVARCPKRPSACPELVSCVPKPLDGRRVSLQLGLDRFLLAHTVEENKDVRERENANQRLP